MPGRKRALELLEFDDQEIQTNITPPTKRSKASDIRSFFSSHDQAPLSKVTQTPAKPSKSAPRRGTVQKATATKKANPKNAPFKNTDKIYQALLKAASKEFNTLLRKQKPNTTPGMSYGVTSNHYSRVMASYLPPVVEMVQESPRHAFLMVMYLSDRSYGSVDTDFKSSGYGGTEDPFKGLDKCLLAIIEKRMEIDGHVTDNAEDPGLKEVELANEIKNWTDRVGRYPKNKKEHVEYEKRRKADLKDRLERMKERRGVAKDWIANALEDLLQQRDWIEQFGLGKHFFRQSIRKLKEIKGTPLTEPEAKSAMELDR